MKTIKASLFLAAVLMLIVPVKSKAKDKYVEAMKKNIEALNNAKTIDELQSSVNAFERIASKEKNKWEPYYYIGFGSVMMATREQEAAKKDAFLDQAQNAVNKAKEIAPGESEVVALEGFINMIRVTVAPGSRGQQYAPMAMQLFNKAIALNPENPRALILLAQMQFGTAQFFGSPTTEACATLDKGMEKLDSYKSDNPLAPQWGRGMAESVKQQCAK